jgi:hypothetical protein
MSVLLAFGCFFCLLRGCDRVTHRGAAETSCRNLLSQSLVDPAAEGFSTKVYDKSWRQKVVAGVV